MSDLRFVLYSLKYRFLNSFLSIMLTAFGVSIALLISQFGNHIQNRINLDGQGIDIVVGAKGSPLQLILSSVYHIDIPTGNIAYSQAKKIMNNPQIKESIPLALGDNWRGFRIVGTTTNYIRHYDMSLSTGRYWDQNFEVVVGSSVNLDIGDEFMGVHGLLEDGSSHEEHKYDVVGILKPSGTVLDRLILTSLNSVLDIHGLHKVDNSFEKNHEHQHDHEHHKEEHHDVHEHDHDKEKHKSEDENHHKHSKNDKKTNKTNELGSSEITALLIKTKSPIANINLPRSINRESSLQAANPALEINRLISLFGIGSKSFAILSLILILIASLNIFSGLASNLENRMGDLAVLRAVGFSKKRIFKIIVLEGILVVLIGIILGILIGFLLFSILTHNIFTLQTTNASLIFNLDFILIILFVFFAGLIAAIFPAYRGSKISIANQLSRTI
tara:strand:- start:47 stop:1378 length:1332 start_codon:yes stop_codon:yes gene_type:complete